MEANDNLEIGDVVQLKSGGPLMTLTYINGNQSYAVWITPDGIEHRISTTPKAFRKVEPI